VGRSSHHFPVRKEFIDSSYAKRYELLYLKLVRERLYNAACFIMSEEKGGLKGRYHEASDELTSERFMASLLGHALGYAKTRRR